MPTSRRVHRDQFSPSIDEHRGTIARLCLWALLLLVFPSLTPAQNAAAAAPNVNYIVVPDFFQLPAGESFVEVAGIAISAKGHIYVFHRGKHPLIEFDPAGKFVRSIADDLFVTAHAVRVDLDDNIWTVDVGSHVVLKLSPAFDSGGNIYVTDGYGNSRVLKFDKYGNFLHGWGMKGSAPGQFDLPHTIAIDGDLVYVGDRENARIQIFDTTGRFREEWRDVGHPFGLFITPDHAIYMSDAMAGRILKLSTDGKILGAFGEGGRGPGRIGDPHQISVAKDGSIFTANVVNWRADKFRLR